jgi:hypothetical protein
MSASQFIDEFSESTEVPRSVKEAKLLAMSACKSYYALAAASRRRQILEDERELLLAKLFAVRSKLERAICAKLESAVDVTKTALTKQFFGYSQKQGVSLRYPLLSCVPTARCGGRCYGHDGRDRELHHIFRGCLNYAVGRLFENGDEEVRSKLIRDFHPICQHAVKEAIEDQERAQSEGYSRLPRIRFSHIGEVAATPHFANALAKLIHEIDPAVQCVIYTRHPGASDLDPDEFVINFTLEAENDPRKKFAPEGSRLVASAWDGKINSEAEVSFLEHHVSDVHSATGSGFACPVTSQHDKLKSCDEARCARCFIAPSTRRRSVSG